MLAYDDRHNYNDRHNHNHRLNSSLQRSTRLQDARLQRSTQLQRPTQLQSTTFDSTPGCSVTTTDAPTMIAYNDRLAQAVTKIYYNIMIHSNSVYNVRLDYGVLTWQLIRC